jgi:glycosyltransferase involved in cell wall biosynthesis
MMPPAPTATPSLAPDLAQGEMQVKLTVVLPAYNEQRAVATVVREVASALADWDETWEVLVIDDASTDDTAREASGAGATVVTRPQRRGYGAAVKTGIRKARGEWIALLDADGSYDPAVLPRMLEMLPAHDQVNGQRIAERGNMAPVRGPIKLAIRKLAEWISGQRIPDLNTGLKVFKRGAALDYLWTLPDGFSASTSLTLAFLCDGRLVAYVPAAYRPRIGESKFHPLHDTLRYVATIGRMVLYFRPLRVFLPLAALILAVALPKAGWDALRSPHGLHDADVILLSLAALAAMFGLLAELIVAQRRGRAET